MTTHVWIRAESKPAERRVPVVPADAAKLVAAGCRVTVERSTMRCIPDKAYADAGCMLAEEGSWSGAPADALVLGLKELPDDTGPLAHRHILFGHAFKGQAGAKDLLTRFRDGGGALYDLEYLVDGTGRRIAAFGYWAGYAGAAVGLKCWAGQQQARTPPVAPLSSYASKNDLIGELRNDLAKAVGDKRPLMLVIGALGRCGTGATDLAANFELPVTKWDMAETAGGGPFDAILDHDILVNAVLASPDCPVFVTKEMAARQRRLSVISDVSCDPSSPYNPLPVYSEGTDFSDPALRVADGPPPLDVVSIDHLPSLLPAESSADYSGQLLPALMTLNSLDDGIWARARAVFDRQVADL